MTYRPCGSLNWLISRLSGDSWYFFGCIGTEFRSLASCRYASDLTHINGQDLIVVRDEYSVKYGDKADQLIETRIEEFRAAGGLLDQVTEMPLFESMDYILEKGASAIAQSNGQMIFDITSFPKRFWFPLLKKFLVDPKIRNLVVTYTRAASYADSLFEDINRTMDEPLPGFGGQKAKAPLWVASAGFMIDSLKSFAGSNASDDLRVLFPFPVSLENMRREWLSIAKLQDELKPGRFELYRVDPRNVSLCFDRLLSFARDRKKPLAFAPFGPKPISLAMCLYASLENTASVHYPQPSVYNPDYSSGIYQDDPSLAIDAYLIKCGGVSLYEVPER